ncbi:MAG: xanthine dehydrogenase small subunit [Marinilabiliales bacterium]|nr:MAG: xanthine dehydrogenase small subunit [Marinilabiliales bacterium]
MKINNKISFVLDGKIQEVEFNNIEYSPTTTLLHYLRTLSGHKSVKEGCGEGDCVACTVVIADLVKGKMQYRAYDSCLIFLPSVHGKYIITSENLGTSDNLHLVQKALYEFDGSQCGFCTPGFVMSMYALYKQENVPDKAEITDALAGNLCRCTGYRPIIQATEYACKNKTVDDIEKSESKTKQLLNSIDRTLTIKIETDEQKYWLPFSKTEALKLRRDFPNAVIVSGSTDVALRVTKKNELIPEIIDLSQVVDMSFVSESKDIITFGANYSLEDVRLKSKNKLSALYEMLSYFGSRQIRNRACLGGNLGSASTIGDSIPVLMAYDADLYLKKAGAQRKVKLREFITGYRQTLCEKDELITKVEVPLPDKDTIVKSYKNSKRKDLDISTVSACFSLKLEKDKVVDIAIFYGGMAAWTKRAEKTEKALLGKEWNRTNVEMAMKELINDYKPISDARSGAEARNIMAANLLLKFWSETAK